MRLWEYELPSPLGPLRASLDDSGRLGGLAFGGLDPRTTMPVPPRAHQDLVRFLHRQLKAYFDGTLRTFNVPMAPQGTEFQRQVWEELQTIPYGRTLSYGELAKRLGNPSLTRAVGAANGANPIAILIPCHRVIGSDGSLTGYAGGLERKRFLLELEGAIPRPTLLLET